MMLKNIVQAFGYFIISSDHKMYNNLWKYKAI